MKDDTQDDGDKLNGFQNDWIYLFSALNDKKIEDLTKKGGRERFDAKRSMQKMITC